MRRWVRPLTSAILALSLTLVAAPPATALSRQGTWRGPTSQAHVIRFGVNAAQKITFVAFKVDIDGAFCSGTITWQASQLRVPIRADGTFVISGRDGLDSFAVRGDFVARNRATGTLRTSVIEDCIGGGRATWTAQRV